MDDNYIRGLAKKEWYFQGFNGTLTLLAGITRSGSVELVEKLGYGFDAIVVYYEHDKCYFLYAWDDLHHIHDQLMAKVKADKEYLAYLTEEDEKVCNESLLYFQGLDSIDLSKKSLEELQGLLIQIDQAYANSISVSHMIEGWTLTTEQKIRDTINSITDDPHALVILTSPTFIPFQTKEQISMNSIANYVREKGLQHVGKKELDSDEQILSMLKDHQSSFFWINNSYASAKDLQVEDFLAELNEILKKPAKEFEDPRENKRKKDELLKKLESAELSELIQINDTIFRIHDRRKEYLTIGLHYIEMVLEELHKRTGFSRESLRYLLPLEVSKVESMKEELLRRREKCIHFSNAKEQNLYSGDEAEKYVSMFSELLKIEQSDTIKGSGASPGVVRGKVKVCRGESEIAKVEKGDVLVACMTQPEFVPAMKKASAIVTDEGGLTCHAAIVSRELGIPCVIGTKSATKLLQDGDMVEVDADNGVVRKLK